MATVTESRHADDVEQALVQLDADFAAVYGPDLGTWSKGVRGEYLETLRSHRTADREAHPVHPRKASASRRRRHGKQLPWRVHQIAPNAVTVLLTPIWTDTHGPAERVFVVTARDGAGQHLKLPRGGSRQLASLMQGAHPEADWNRAQTWRADGNRITGWQQGRAV
jgi:hypothetical protein